MRNQRKERGRKLYQSHPCLKMKKKNFCRWDEIPKSLSQLTFFHLTNKSSSGLGKKYLKNLWERFLWTSQLVLIRDDPPLLHSPTLSLWAASPICAGEEKGLMSHIFSKNRQQLFSLVRQRETTALGSWSFWFLGCAFWNWKFQALSQTSWSFSCFPVSARRFWHSPFG